MVVFRYSWQCALPDRNTELGDWDQGDGPKQWWCEGCFGLDRADKRKTTGTRSTDARGVVL